MELALRESISRIRDVPAERIQDGSTLADLGFDSLACAEVLTDLEIRLGKQLPIDALRRLNQAQTVGDLGEILHAAFVDAPQTPSEVELLRADGLDVARTFRAWQVRLRVRPTPSTSSALIHSAASAAA